VTSGAADDHVPPVRRAEKTGNIARVRPVLRRLRQDLRFGDDPARTAAICYSLAAAQLAAELVVI
jgi:hypothetical protein